MADGNQGNTSVRIVLVEDVELEGKLLTRALVERGITDVVQARDINAALKQIDDNIPSIVITDIELAGESGIDLIRRVRARTGAPYVYIMVLTGKATPERMKQAFDAGADDHAVKPFRRDELVARIRAAERIVRLERTLFARATELEAALRKLDEGAAGEALARAVARESRSGITVTEELLRTMPWEKLSDVLKKSLGEFAGVELSSAPTQDPQAAIVGEVFMSDAARKLEVGVTVVVGGASMRALSRAMLGDDTDVESGCALVLESANILMGSLKSALSTFGYDFAAGLPTSPKLADARASYDAHPIHQRFAFRADAIEVDIWVSACQRRVDRIRGVDLREGMVVAEDVHDEHGRLLVRSGVRLTQTTAERLGKFVTGVDVMVGS